MQVSEPNAPPLLFVHLPKTAGGSIKAMIEHAYKPPDLYLFYQDHYTDNHQAAAEAREARLIYGHFSHGFHAYLGCAPRYTCFLRNPVERTISHYYHLVNVELGSFGDLAREAGSVGEFINRRKMYANSNMMCRILSGFNDRGDVSDDALFGRAMRHLEEQFPVFGITEMMPLSLEVMRRSIGLQSVAKLPRVNKGSYDLPSISAEDMQRVVEANQADLRLYRWAVDRFLSVIVPSVFKDEPLLVPSEVSGPESEQDGEVPLARCA